ncbi:MAG: hypothetical protein GX136_01625 [Clostridiales bacterium]|jgi:hypothetical protein|nr:hypothetical protein [Clostridiales bacterium]
MADTSKEPVNPKKENVKLSGSVFLWTFFAAVLNIIIYFSMTVIFSGLFTKNIGEDIYEKSEDGSVSLVTRIIYSETTTGSTQTTSAAETATTASTSSSSSGVTTGTGTATGSTGTEVTQASGSTENTTLPTNQYKQSIRSEMPAGAESALVIISQTFMLILLVAMVYSKLWERGDKDNNRVNFNRMPEDKLRGLKVGLMAAIPSFAFYLLLVVSKLGLITDKYFALYRFLNISFMPIINRLAGAGVSSSRDVSWVSFLVILLTLSVVPLAAHLAYILGYKQISISEKIIYVNPEKRRKRRKRRY